MTSWRGRSGASRRASLRRSDAPERERSQTKGSDVSSSSATLAGAPAVPPTGKRRSPSTTPHDAAPSARNAAIRGNALRGADATSPTCDRAGTDLPRTSSRTPSATSAASYSRETPHNTTARARDVRRRATDHPAQALYRLGGKATAEPGEADRRLRAAIAPDDRAADTDDPIGGLFVVHGVASAPDRGELGLQSRE